MTNAFFNQAAGAYAAASREAVDPDVVEYRVFAQITAEMEAAKDTTDPLQKDLHQALFNNARIWSAIAVDVATPENKLPDGLKAQLIYLSEFMRLQRTKVIKGEEKIDGMIEINKMIMQGLTQRLNAKAEQNPASEVSNASFTNDNDTVIEKAPDFAPQPYITARSLYMTGV